MTDYDELYSAPDRNLTIVTTAYRVRAGFRLFHDDLDPERVTEAFGVRPTKTHRRGDPNVGKSGMVFAPFPQGAWLLSTKDKVRSLDANDHIGWLLNELAHCTSALHQFQEEGCYADIMCGWFAQSDNTCPILNVETIRKLARFRLSCWFDVYLFPPVE